MINPSREKSQEEIDGCESCLPPTPNTFGYSINDSGLIAGMSEEYHPNLKNHYFTPITYSNGRTNSLGHLGYRYNHPYGQAFDVNNLGQTVGYSSTSEGSIRAFVHDESMIQLNVLPGFTSSAATSINDLGQVVGYLRGSGNEGFIYDDEQITNLNNLIPDDPGWTIEYPESINNKGQIVGFGKLNNRDSAFLLNPIVSASESKVTVGNISTFGDTGCSENSLWTKPRGRFYCSR